MCYHPRSLLIKNEHPTNAYPEAYLQLKVPCGKCVSCLKRRQVDYSTRLLREVQDAGTMFFVTLTYNNAHIPIMRSTYRVDKDSGEMERIYSSELVTNEKLLYKVRGDLAQIKSSPMARFVTHYVGDSAGNELVLGNHYYLTRFTPSLNREDVKNWIKGCRVQYKRDNGKSLDFRYAWCGEYGPNGCRPHYHLIFINIDKQALIWMLERWKQRGYYLWKEVPQLNPDGTNARQLACRYIGKYVSKGKFDCNSVTQQEAQKGRLCNSKHFGTKDFTSEELAYYRAYDLYGEYDIDSFALVPKFATFNFRDYKFLDDKQRLNVVKEVVKRAGFTYRFTSGDSEKEKVFTLPLPKAFKLRLYSILNKQYDKKEKKFKNVYRSSFLQRKVADYLQSLADVRDKRKFEQFCAERHLSKDDSEAFVKFWTLSESDETLVSETLDESNFAFSIVSASTDYQ